MYRVFIKNAWSLTSTSPTHNPHAVPGKGIIFTSPWEKYMLVKIPSVFDPKKNRRCAGNPTEVLRK
jgi:hypothetical protein